MASEVNASSPYVEGRGFDLCRGCRSQDLFSGLDLGNLPIANELLISCDLEIDKFPLHLRICKICNLGQVADVVTPERIFRDYRYLSSMSSTFLSHARKFVLQQVNSGFVSKSDWVLEIASNDGYLLKNFLELGIKVIGVEPAENVADVSRELGIQTISEFFTSQLAENLFQKQGYPKLIIANNVMAHVPDLIDFLNGLSILCGPKTRISIENPSLANILFGMQFDTIYHEHYSYLSASSVRKIGEMNGLILNKVEELPTHGGSNRYWLSKLGSGYSVDESVDRIIDREESNGLFSQSNWSNYAERVNRILKGFQAWLQAAKLDGRRVFGYGAAAKASTILNAIDFDRDSILAIADISSEKQNRFMPAHGIKIISPMDLFSSDPTDVLIFPWNIKSEISSFLLNNLKSNVRLWCVIPEMHQVVS